jgi:hypothetical protein
MMNSFTTSFVKLFGHNVTDEVVINKIRIPLIQRDYAQGRDGEKVSRIRKSFLNVLHNALVSDNMSNVGLDFVYGDIKADGALEPLDGQQRLTTLFLLHIYLAHRAGIKITMSDMWTQFSYETRMSARLFCERIVEYHPSPDELNEMSLSKWIIDQPWYIYTWRHDPTIKAMLTMLDDIHEAFKSDDAVAAWDRLNDPQNPAITFHLLPLEETNASAQLYIKMNSRGKPLTDFETFKANFERMLDSSNIARVDEFSKKVDGAWSDMLWSYREDDDIIDDEFMRYFRFITEVRAWKDADIINVDVPSTDINDLVKYVYGPDNPNAQFNFNFLIACFDTWQNENTEDWFSKRFTLNAPPLESDNTYPVVIGGIHGNQDIDFFKIACSKYGMPSAQGRGRLFPLYYTLYLYAVLLVRLSYSDNYKLVFSPTDTFPPSGCFQKRLRTLRNLIEVSKENELRFDKMPQMLNDIERIIIKDELDGVLAFNSQQILEEKDKRNFIHKNPELETVLYKLEDHPLLRGCLAAFELNHDKFIPRANAFHTLFKDFNNFDSISTALLVTGDYSRKAKNNRFFQLGAPSSVNNSKGNWFPQIGMDGKAIWVQGLASPYWWRRLLTESGRSNISGLRATLAELLDHVAEQLSYTKQSANDLLKEIPALWLKKRENEQIYDWRTYFVKYQEMREGASGRYVGMNGRLSYQICMLSWENFAGLGYFRDPYLLAIYHESKVCDAVEDPWFKGHNENVPRWMELKKSRIALQCVENGFLLRLPESPENRKIFSSVCKEFEITYDPLAKDVLFRIPQTERDGLMIDNIDRVERCAQLLRCMVERGL